MSSSDRSTKGDSKPSLDHGREERKEIAAFDSDSEDESNVAEEKPVIFLEKEIELPSELSQLELKALGCDKDAKLTRKAWRPIGNNCLGQIVTIDSTKMFAHWGYGKDQEAILRIYNCKTRRLFYPIKLGEYNSLDKFELFPLSNQLFAYKRLCYTGAIHTSTVLCLYDFANLTKEKLKYECTGDRQIAVSLSGNYLAFYRLEEDTLIEIFDAQTKTRKKLKIPRSVKEVRFLNDESFIVYLALIRENIGRISIYAISDLKLLVEFPITAWDRTHASMSGRTFCLERYRTKTNTIYCVDTMDGDKESKFSCTQIGETPSWAQPIYSPTDVAFFYNGIACIPEEKKSITFTIDRNISQSDLAFSMFFDEFSLASIEGDKFNQYTLIHDYKLSDEIEAILTHHLQTSSISEITLGYLFGLFRPQNTFIKKDIDPLISRLSKLTKIAKEQGDEKLSAQSLCDLNALKYFKRQIQNNSTEPRKDCIKKVRAKHPGLSATVNKLLTKYVENQIKNTSEKASYKKT